MHNFAIHKSRTSPTQSSLGPASMSSLSVQGRRLFAADQQVDAWVSAHASSSPETARALQQTLCGVACAVWLCGPGTEARARQVALAAAARGELFLFVLYNVPNRDCGSYSAGGACSADEYLCWVQAMARAIGAAEGIIVLEPDALAHALGFQQSARDARLALLRRACDILKQECPRTRVYVDIGHPQWLSPQAAAELFSQTNTNNAAGFSINVSNMHPTQACVDYGNKICSLLRGNASFIVDVSRNGAGVCETTNGAPVWLNNPGSRLGQRPTTNVSVPACDALLWVKVPGESDGEGYGAPAAGAFWPDGALRLSGETQPKPQSIGFPPTHGRRLFAADQQVDAWVRDNRLASPAIAHALQQSICGVPCAVWLCGPGTEGRARQVAAAAAARGELFQIVLYNVPNRDCGNYSAGGACSTNEYLGWVQAVASAIGAAEGMIVLEPDALAHAAEFQQQTRDARLALLRNACDLLAKQCPRARVYLDIGHPQWLSPQVAAQLVRQVCGNTACGFAINVSNMHPTQACIDYGSAICKLLPGKARFVVDVSRNGAGVCAPTNGAPVWLNNPGSRLGQRPTTSTPHPACDALLWVKIPGESDGEGYGAPPAGVFWPDGAMRLSGQPQQQSAGEKTKRRSGRGLRRLFS